MRKLLSVEISGNLLSEALLETLSDDSTKHPYAQPESFRWYRYDVVDTKQLQNARIASAYEQLLGRWDLYYNELSEMPVGELRDKWIRYFFRQFGYELEYQQAALEAGELKFNLSHRGWNDEHAPVIHTALFSRDLDRKSEERGKYSSHDTLQRYLINKKSERWGIVTNGKELRILRDFFHETRKAYIMFDLETIFEGRNFQDFRLLWRLIHPSRFLPRKDKEFCILEDLFEESRAAGVAIGEDLRYNVRQALESLGNGFMKATPGLTEKLSDNLNECQEFHHELLRVVYRVIFLLYAEQRNLMPGTSSLYFQEYSISALRAFVEIGTIPEDDFVDLWEGLRATFQMVYAGVPELHIPNYNGLLFHPDEIRTLAGCHCRNTDLLQAMQYLTTFEKGGILQRISYVELGVDEIGAIYEGLLEYIPRVSAQPEVFEDTVRENGKHRQRERNIPPRTFFLDPRGTNRKTSGSYYTNPQLVNALIDSALKPVLEDRLKQAERDGISKTNAVLELKVCDPACGSGAFLIAATEFLGQELAKIQTGDDYPSDMAIRHARREVLRHCIYGVDLNPLSAELAKVSLWLTAATDDQPLNFLDHHIKCGNSLIGATPELIQKGIPADAYNPVTGDDKQISQERKRIHREYLKQKEKDRLQYTLHYKHVSTASFIIHEPDLADEFNEDSSEDIDQLKQEYESFRQKDEFKWKNLIADYWTAAFFWPHDNSDEIYPNQQVLDTLIEREHSRPQPELAKKVKDLANDFRFFHWHLEFPEVFEKGGFDCVLGNPPWEMLQIEEQQYFANIDKRIAQLSGSERKEAINILLKNNPTIAHEYFGAKRTEESKNRFIKYSTIFKHTAIGKLNSYALFADLSCGISIEDSYIGLILPTGLVTDNSTKKFFSHLLKRNKLKSIIGFINSKKIFPGIKDYIKFALVCISRSTKSLFTFNLVSVDDIKDDIRYFT